MNSQATITTVTQETIPQTTIPQENVSQGEISRETLSGILSKIKIPFPPPLLDQDLLPKMKKGKLPFRTTNQFLLYRTALIKTLFKNGYYEYNMRDISRLASKLWKLEPEYVQREYRTLALKVKKIHREYELDSIQRNILMNKVDVIRVHDSPDRTRGHTSSVFPGTSPVDDTPNLNYYNNPPFVVPNFYDPPSLEAHSLSCDGTNNDTLNSHDASHVDMYNTYDPNFEPSIVYPVHNLTEQSISSYDPNFVHNLMGSDVDMFNPSYGPSAVYSIHNSMEPNTEQNNHLYFNVNDVNTDYYANQL